MRLLHSRRLILLFTVGSLPAGGLNQDVGWWRRTVTRAVHRRLTNSELTAVPNFELRLFLTDLCNVHLLEMKFRI